MRRTWAKWAAIMLLSWSVIVGLPAVALSADVVHGDDQQDGWIDLLWWMRR